MELGLYTFADVSPEAGSRRTSARTSGCAT